MTGEEIQPDMSEQAVTSTGPDKRLHRRITASDGWFAIPWREIVDYKDLLWLLVKRDLTAIYKQTVLGPLWFIIQPLFTTVVFTVIFGRVAKISTDGVPHFIFYMCGTVFWGYFQGCMTHSANSLVNNARLYSKVYFPRLIIPLSGLFVNLAHFALNAVMLAGFFVYFYFFKDTGLSPSKYFPLVVLLVIQAPLLGLGVGIWVAALTTRYRDFSFALPLIAQLWMYATPIVYPASLVVNPTFVKLLWLNPMSFIVETARFLITGSGSVTLAGGLTSVVMTLMILFSGLVLFNKVQRTFVDTV